MLKELGINVRMDIPMVIFQSLDCQKCFILFYECNTLIQQPAWGNYCRTCTLLYSSNISPLLLITGSATTSWYCDEKKFKKEKKEGQKKKKKRGKHQSNGRPHSHGRPETMRGRDETHRRIKKSETFTGEST